VLRSSTAGMRIGSSRRLPMSLCGACWAFPPDLQSTSLLSGAGLDEVVTALGLRDGQVLLDLACGRGGYGLEIARRSGSRVVGMDFSAVAIEQAQRRAQALGLADRADFRVGELTGTRLSTASVDAVLIVDSIQFATIRRADAGRSAGVLSSSPPRRTHSHHLLGIPGRHRRAAVTTNARTGSAQATAARRIRGGRGHRQTGVASGRTSAVAGGPRPRRRR
jgi:SAM-dependent methyltransferase